MAAAMSCICTDDHTLHYTSGKFPQGPAHNPLPVAAHLIPTPHLQKITVQKQGESPLYIYITLFLTLLCRMRPGCQCNHRLAAGCEVQVGTAKDGEGATAVGEEQAEQSLLILHLATLRLHLRP